MPFFTGTAKEFNLFFGPFVRNLVQNKSRNWKRLIGNKCEGVPVGTCNYIGELDAAHSTHLSRVELVKLVYQKLQIDGVVDLEEAKLEIANLHTRDSMRLLCRLCHDIYDGRKV